MTRLAGATLAAILGLFSISPAQKDEVKAVDASKVKIVRMQNLGDGSKLGGTMTDQNGAVVPGAKILLTNENQKLQAVSDSEGVYDLVIPKSGIYKLKATYPGFEVYTLTNLRVEANEKLTLDIELKVNGDEVVGELSVEPTLIESTPTLLQTVILTPRKLEKPN